MLHDFTAKFSVPRLVERLDHSLRRSYHTLQLCSQPFLLGAVCPVNKYTADERGRKGAEKSSHGMDMGAAFAVGRKWSQVNTRTVQVSNPNPFKSIQFPIVYA